MIFLKIIFLKIFDIFFEKVFIYIFFNLIYFLTFWDFFLQILSFFFNFWDYFLIFFWKFLRFFVVENVWVFFFWFFSCWKCLIFFLKILRLKKKHFDIFFLLKMFEIFFLKLLIFFLKLLSFFFVLKCFWFFRFWNFLSFFSLISIRKIFLDETSRNFYFEHFFTSKTYFCDFGISLALVLLRNY